MPDLARQQPRRERATIAAQACRRSLPNAINAIPATQSDGRYLQVPYLSYKIMIDIIKCQICRLKIRGDNGRSLRSINIINIISVKQSGERYFQISYLSRKVMVDETKRHVMHTVPLYVDKLCVHKLSVSKFSVDKLYGNKLYVNINKA